MKRKLAVSLCFIIACLIIVISSESCKKLEPPIPAPETSSGVMTRGIFNDAYFDWDRLDSIPVNGLPQGIDLPWAEGSMHSAGIPAGWIDRNAYDNNPENRMYSRENGWRLVYSNLNDPRQTNKYFAVYNEYTGLLRFFLYSLNTASGPGTSCAFIGLGVNASTRLFNFTDEFARAIETSKNAPTFIYSPNWTFSNGSGSPNIGYNSQQWYGIEVECSYDPYQNSSHNKIGIRLWGTDLTTLTGTGITTGQIHGTLTQTSFNSSNITLDYTKNHNSRTTIINQSEAEKQIEKTVQNNGNFGQELWNNIRSEFTKQTKKNISEIVGEGIKTIFSEGGKVVSKVLGKMFSSIIGKGNEPVLQKIDLTLNANTTFNATSVTEYLGYGVSTLFPLPGTVNNDPPLYNTPLGVWNLEKAPRLRMDMNATIKQTRGGEIREMSFNKEYYLVAHTIKVILNPQIAENFDLKNYSEELLFTNNSYIYPYVNMDNSAFEPCGIFANDKYYKLWNNGLKTDYAQIYEESDFEYHFNQNHCGAFKVRVSFDLVNKTDPSVGFSFSKVFYMEGEQGRMWTTIEYVD